ncbi:hypothetical protein [Luteibacter sp. CQ10]|uniref:hypothetical protein n=1 Tax=Luteibacter sp. CQ10 TaxID=2805821 RepID=UPI0034A51091
MENQNVVEVVRPLGRQLAHELSAEEINQVSGALQKVSKTVCAGVSSGGDAGVDAGIDW